MARVIILNKPFEVMCQFTDTGGRANLSDYLPVPSVYAAGRLDYRSEGLLVLTDDGTINHRLTDPKFGHPRTYLAQLEGLATPQALYRLNTEILLADQDTLPIEAAIVEPPSIPPRPVPVRDYHPTCWIRLVLREGKKHQVRRMTAAVGHPTLRLVRYAIGRITLDGLAPGAWRQLSPGEIHELMNPARQNQVKIE